MGVKTYRNYTCASCKKTAKTERVLEGLSLGNPLFKCQRCGALNYDAFIFEPALLDPEVLVKDEKKKYNTYLLLLYMPVGLFAGFALSMVLNSFAIGFGIVCIPLAVLTALILKKKNSVNTDRFAEAIYDSMKRLRENEQYADIVISHQGNHPNSVWSNRDYFAP